MPVYALLVYRVSILRMPVYALLVYRVSIEL
jgi:hypothetical protein